MRNELRSQLPALPVRMRKLPVNGKGYPVPYFVKYVNGDWDFRVVDEEKYGRCLSQHVCWLCGEKLGVRATFVVGPMCTVTRVSAEPPSHHDCAIFAAQACPFLILPKAIRREANMPSSATPLGGDDETALMHNPGATALFVTRSWRLIAGGSHGSVVLRMGDPESVTWYAKGRQATRAEVLEAFDLGLPKLRAIAEKDGAAQLEKMESLVAKALLWLPPGARCVDCKGTGRNWVSRCNSSILDYQIPCVACKGTGMV